MAEVARAIAPLWRASPWHRYTGDWRPGPDARASDAERWVCDRVEAGQWAEWLQQPHALALVHARLEEEELEASNPEHWHHAVSCEWEDDTGADGPREALAAWHRAWDAAWNAAWEASEEASEQ